MKNCIYLFVIACLLMAFTNIAYAAKGTIDSLQTPGQGKVKKEAAIPGYNDKRVIIPQMNVLERYETMRKIKKRAAAKRNALMLQAAGQNHALKGAGSPGQIPSN